MPAYTPKGYPYPLGTDLISESDTTIQILAQFIDSWLGKAAAGSPTVSGVSANTATQLAVTFPAGLFTAAPYVQVSVNSNSPANVVASVSSAGVTTSGMTLVGYRTTNGPLNFAWFAVQLP